MVERRHSTHLYSFEERWKKIEWPASLILFILCILQLILSFTNIKLSPWVDRSVNIVTVIITFIGAIVSYIGWRNSHNVDIDPNSVTQFKSW